MCRCLRSGVGYWGLSRPGVLTVNREPHQEDGSHAPLPAMCHIIIRGHLHLNIDRDNRQFCQRSEFVLQNSYRRAEILCLWLLVHGSIHFAKRHAHRALVIRPSPFLSAAAENSREPAAATVFLLTAVDTPGDWCSGRVSNKRLSLSAHVSLLFLRSFIATRIG